MSATVEITPAQTLETQFASWKKGMMLALIKRFDAVVGEATPRALRLTGDPIAVPKKAVYLYSYCTIFKAGPSAGNADRVYVEEFEPFALIQILRALENGSYVPTHPCK